MSYKVTTNRDSDYTESLVRADLIKRGWMVLTPSSRDSFYDFVVDLGNKFVTLQVKILKQPERYGRMEHPRICKVVERYGEKGRSTKKRNSIDYAEKGVDWLVGVCVKTGDIYYYALETYGKLKQKSFSVHMHTPDEFPINYDVVSNLKGEQNEDRTIREKSR